MLRFYNNYKTRAEEIEAVFFSDRLDTLHEDKEFVQKLVQFMNEIPDAHVVMNLWSVIQENLQLLMAAHPHVSERVVALATCVDPDINWSTRAWEILFPKLGQLFGRKKTTMGHLSMKAVRKDAKEWLEHLGTIHRCLNDDYKFTGDRGVWSFKELRHSWPTLTLDGKSVTTFKVAPIFVNDQTGGEWCPSKQEFSRFLEPIHVKTLEKMRTEQK